MNLLSFFDATAEPYLRHRRSAATLRVYRIHAGQCDATPIKNWTRKTVEAHIRRWRKTLCGNSVNARLSAVRSIFDVAVIYSDETKVLHNPCAGVEGLSVPDLLPRAVEDHMRLLAAAKDDRDRVAFALLGMLGLRSAEARSVTAKDIRGGKLFIVGKGSKERSIELSPRVLEILAPVLHSPGRLLPVSEDVLRAMVKGMAARAGVAGKASPHRLRSAFAVAAIEGGANLDALRETMGHASMDTTLVYARGAKRNTLAVVEAAAQGGRT